MTGLPAAARPAVPLREVVGASARRLREAAGVRQDDISAAARAFGLAWPRSKVAALERGEKAISAEGLVLLPAILGRAFDRKVHIGELFDVDDRVQLSKTAHASARGVAEVLAGAGDAGRYVRADSGIDRSAAFIGEPERRASKRLGTSSAEFAVACASLWGRSLSQERDARLSAADGAPHRLAGLRGRVTRALVAEARQYIERLPAS